SLPVTILARWIARRIVEIGDHAPLLRDRVADLALHRNSPELAFAAWADDVGRGLATAALVVERNPSVAPEFEALLRSQPEGPRLEWCFGCSVEPLRDLASRIGADLLKAQGLSAAALAARCDGRPLGA